MAGTVVEFEYNANGMISSPVPLGSEWMTLIDAGANGVTVDDADPITDPDGDIASAKHIIGRVSRGSTLRLRLGYTAGNTLVTNPIVKVFGKTTDGGMWQILENRAGELRAELRTEPTLDMDDGALLYTHPLSDQNAWDCENYDQILVGVEVPYAITGMTQDADAIVQARMV